jgi:hypothetical protein
VPGETDAESWQLLEDAHGTRAELTQQLEAFLCQLPDAPADLLDSHRLLSVSGSSGDPSAARVSSFSSSASGGGGDGGVGSRTDGMHRRAVAGNGMTNRPELSGSLRENKFMGT